LKAELSVITVGKLAVFVEHLKKTVPQFHPVPACVGAACAVPAVPQDLQHICLRYLSLQQLLMG